MNKTLLFFAAIIAIVVIFSTCLVASRAKNTTKSAACKPSGDDTPWQAMFSAPRDGTVIELRNDYGVASSFGLAKWTDQLKSMDGSSQITNSHPVWEFVDKLQANNFMDGDNSLSWRPYHGEISAYVDPTCGFQEDPKYWREAVAKKYGLPLDYFEAEAAKNAAANAKH
jgi:hypothetical protein